MNPTKSNNSLRRTLAATERLKLVRLGSAFAMAAVLSIAIVTTFGTVQMASAAPQEAHGTCGPFDTPGAFGCHGDVGGYTILPNGECKVLDNSPYNHYSCLS